MLRSLGLILAGNLAMTAAQAMPPRIGQAKELSPMEREFHTPEKPAEPEAVPSLPLVRRSMDSAMYLGLTMPLGLAPLKFWRMH